MEFKKLFENPEIEIDTFAANDIITTSTDGNGDIDLPFDD